MQSQKQCVITCYSTIQVIALKSHWLRCGFMWMNSSAVSERVLGRTGLGLGLGGTRVVGGGTLGHEYLAVQ